VFSLLLLLRHLVVSLPVSVLLPMPFASGDGGVLAVLAPTNDVIVIAVDRELSNRPVRERDDDGAGEKEEDIPMGRRRGRWTVRCFLRD